MPVVIEQRRRPAREPRPKTRPAEKRQGPEFGTATLKLYPVLARAALAAKQDKLAWLWHIARAVDADGRGLVDVSALAGWIAEQGLSGFSPSSLSRVVRAGDGIFWHVHTSDGAGRLALVGLAKLTAALGAGRLDQPILCPVPKTLKTWRAVSTFGFTTGGKTISQTTIGGLVDKTDRTIRNYRRALGDLLDTRHNARLTGRAWTPGEDIPDGFIVDLVDGRLVLLEIMPNTYTFNVPTAPRGVVRRVNHAQPAFDLVAGNARRFYDAPANERQRHAINRRFQARAEGDFFAVRTSETSRGGWAVWRGFQIVNGGVHGG